MSGEILRDELPAGWAISNVAGLISPDGVFSDGDWVESKDQDPNGSIRLLQLADVGDGEFIDKSNRFINDEKFVQLRCTEILAGDVLIARMPDPLGRACLAPKLKQRSITVVDVAILRPGKKSVSPTWLMHFINSPDTRAYIEQESSGSTRKRIARGKLAEMELPVPPLAEQKRIAEKLEAVLVRVDACRARLDRVPALLKRFRQSVLAAATSGQLTEDWREEHPAVESGEILLSRVLEKRTEAWKLTGRKGDCPEAMVAETSELPAIPYGWTWIPLGNMGANPFSAVQTGPFGALLHTREFISHGVPVVAVGNLTGMGFTKENLYFVSDVKAEELFRFDVQAGDVLFARSGATLGKVCVAPSDAKNWRMTGHILRARLNQYFLLPELCVYALRADPSVTKQVFGSVQGSTRPGYNTGLLESIALPVPPLPEQQEIVRRVEALFAYAERIEARLTIAQETVERLTPSVLAKAFRGHLVPQDPTDEPASALLERLRDQPAAPRLLQRNSAPAVALPPAKSLAATPKTNRRVDAKTVVAPVEPQLVRPPKKAAEAPTPMGDLDRNDLIALLREVLAAHGPCDRTTAIQQTAYALNYQRAGSAVATEIDHAIRAAVRRCVLLNEAQELRVNRASIAEMEEDDREFMKDQFLAAISQGGRVWIERGEAARLYAQWFGFRRTGSQIQDRVKSLINGLLRNHRLESSGTCIRRL